MFKLRRPRYAVGAGASRRRTEGTMRFRGTLILALLAGVALSCCLVGPSRAQAPAATSNDPAALRAEIEHLKSIMPGQSFAMTQVAYNINNLWFAVHARNWPLAQFYFGDARGRLRWALRITPVRKISTGELELQPFLDALEKTQLAKLGETIMAKDVKQFEVAYRATLEGCHACHTASEKPYLDLQIPTAPAEPMIHFAPR
jgi:hypothetical protein